MVLRFFLFASAWVSLAFLFISCADGERDNPYDPGSKDYVERASSGSKQGGSSASVKNYCVYAEIGQCYFGLYSACPGVGGRLDDSCPYNSSSSAAAYSSSPDGGSNSSQSGQSSSSEALPEYGYCVFISDRMCLTGPLRTCPPGGTLSNSCPYGSSSSEAVSSSSSVPSSSSYLQSSSSTLPSSSSTSSSSSSIPPSSSSVATYTVTYNAGTGVTGVTVPANQTKTQNVALTLSTAVPTRTGYAFAGWNTSANGTGMSYASGASYVDNTGVTLYAQWTANTYTVTYNANNGTGAPANQTKTHDITLTLSSTVPTRTGYTFASWNTEANGSGTSYTSGASYTANVGVTLYAQWYPSVSYGGETYKTVVIGTQTWMAKNLNYNVEGSKCHSNNESNCDTYGRLYDWATAMALPDCGYGTSCASQIGTKHKGICPTGWHIPSDAELTVLIDYVGGSSTAGKKLKATSGWSDNGNGTDSYGFAALPGAYGFSGGGFDDVGGIGVWWSASEYDSYYAYCLDMGLAEHAGYGGYNDKGYLFSVRCVRD